MSNRSRFDGSPPRDHPLRAIRALTDAQLEAFEAVRDRSVDASRHRIPTAPLVRALLLQALVSIPNDAILCEQIRTKGLFRWFVGAHRQTTWTPRSIQIGRACLFEAGIAPGVFVDLLANRRCARLLLDQRLCVDLVQFEAWARHGAMSHAEAPPVALGSILLLPRVSDAFMHLPYLEAGGANPPLESVLRRLMAALSGPLAVTAYSRATAAALEPIALGCGARVVTLDPCSQLTQLIEAASLLNVANLAIWEAGAALLPATFIRALCRHHFRTGNDLTIVPDLPEGVGGQIYRTACLHRLRTEAPRDIDLSPREWVEWSRRNITPAKSLRLHSQDLPRQHPPDLPRTATVASRDDWQRIGIAASREVETSANEWRALIEWPRAGRPARTVTHTIPLQAGSGPRVLYVTPSRGFSGPERMYVRLACALLDSGVDLWGLLSQRGMIADLLPGRHRPRFISDEIEFDQPTQSSFMYCLRILREVRPDLVHCNGVPEWPMVAAAQVLGVPLIAHVRVAEVSADEDGVTTAARLIAVSNFVRSELLRTGVEPRRVLVCRDGIDEAFFERDALAGTALRRRLAIDRDAVVVLCVARCSRSKRIETVIQAVAAATPAGKRAHLVIIGEIEDPAYFEFLRDLVARCGLRDATHFLHAVEDMRPYYAAADALMLASVRDPLPNAVLEAMASGTPVIAAESGGIPEMLDDSSGFLVKPESVNGFARALMHVLEGSEQVRRKVRRACILARRDFSLHDHRIAIRRVYRDVVKRSRA